MSKTGKVASKLKCIFTDMKSTPALIVFIQYYSTKQTASSYFVNWFSTIFVNAIKVGFV